MSYDDRYPHAVEGKIEHRSAKSYLVEFTLGGRYFVPFKCIRGGADGPGDPDEDGNRVFEINDWWWKKRDDFEAEPR